MRKTQQILLTGISSALGGVLAKELAKDPNVRIIATMRRKQSHDSHTAANIHIIDQCDLTEPQCCAQIAEVVDDRFHGQFGLVHSVGDFWDHVPFLEVGPDKAKRMLDSHVTTFYNTVQALIPLMKRRSGGSVITFSSLSVRYSYPWMAAFTASKCAVDSLVRSLANEFAGDGLRFNSIALASLKTEMVRQSKPHGDYARFIPPEDIVPIVQFLLTEEAYLVNGNSIDLFRHSDGFYHAGYFQRVAK